MLSVEGPSLPIRGSGRLYIGRGNGGVVVLGGVHDNVLLSRSYIPRGWRLLLSATPLNLHSIDNTTKDRPWEDTSGVSAGAAAELKHRHTSALAECDSRPARLAGFANTGLDNSV